MLCLMAGLLWRQVDLVDVSFAAYLRLPSSLKRSNGARLVRSDTKKRCQKRRSIAISFILPRLCWNPKGNRGRQPLDFGFFARS